jgi:hypothetical protein
VTGSWIGTWNEQTTTNPHSGTIRLDLEQSPGGHVTGQMWLTGASCMDFGSFKGTTTGDLLAGSVTDAISIAEFTVSAEDWNDPGSEDVSGVFTFTQGSGCPTAQCGFIASLVVPLVHDDSTPERVGTAILIDEHETKVRPIWMLRSERDE